MGLIEKLKKIPKIPTALFLSASILFGSYATATEGAEVKYIPTGVEKK